MTQRTRIPAAGLIVILFLFLFPTFSFAKEIRKIDFAEYSNKVAALNSACGPIGMSGFSGFCLSQEYEKATYNNPSQTSITVGLEIASFERFYSDCEHSDFPSINAVRTKSKRIFDAEKYFEEIRRQKEALENYVGRFYSCGTKSDNDATISRWLKWFEYMTGHYSADNASANVSVGSIDVRNESIGHTAGVSTAPSASSLEKISDQNSIQVPDFFAARFVVEVPEFPAGVTNKRIEVHCDQPSSCLFQVGKSNAVRYKLVAQNQLLSFANGALAYAKANPERFLTTNAVWNDRYLRPLLATLVQVDQCMALHRKDYPGGTIFVCSLNAELWPQPAVILIGELKVSYPELFFGTTLFPAFKISSKLAE